MRNAGGPSRVRETALMAGGLAVALIGLVVGLYVSARSARAQREASERVSHTLEVVGEVHGLVAGAADAVRGQRYYLLSGEEGSLAPMYASAEAARQRLRRLVALTRDDPVQQTRLAELDTLLARRFRLLDSVVRVRRAGGLEAARRSLLALGGRAVGTWVDTVAARVRTHEESLLAVRQASLDRAVGQTRTGFAVTGVLVLALTGATYWGLARLADQRRRAQEERDRWFLLSQDMICTADFEGRFVELNPAWERTLGYRLDEMLGRPFLEWVHPDDRERTAAESQRQEREGTRTLSFVNRYRHRDGSYRVLHWTAAPYEAARVVYAAARDITALHEAQEELRRSEERSRLLNEELLQSVDELTTVNQELEAFTYSVSHDLRAPLRHISGFSELLEKHVGGALDEKGKRYIGTIGAAVARMGMLIDDLLMFSRIGRGELHAGPVRLDDVVQAVLPELGQEIARRKVRLELRPLPVVHGDSALLQVVFANLLANALKYTRSREEPRIEVGTDAAREGKVVVFVRDNGVGFDMQYVGKLFGVFQRLHGPEEFEGTGIGLATVQRIVHKHKGRAWAEGAVDRGATFYVALPPADPTTTAGAT